VIFLRRGADKPAWVIPRKMEGHQRLNLHDWAPVSTVNGPGRRAVIWLQGCRFHCPGCFNPETHDLAPRRLVTPEELWEWVKDVTDLEGITISGGEPLLQAAPLADFLRLVRRQSSLSIILYSGYTLRQIQHLPFGAEVLSLLDVLIDGLFERDHLAHDGIRGSTNQQIHFLTDRYTLADFTPRQRCEFLIQPDGAVVHTGVSVMPAPAVSSPSPPRPPS
jgi:anaerobic ribonucleoside-triphosphate reductase activating protein